MRNAFFLLVGLIFIGGSIYLFLQKPAPIQFQEGRTLVKVGNSIYKVEKAITEEEKSNGLSNRDTLDEDGGMLFIFDRAGRYSFWMKGMNFPIDIAWIDSEKRVVWIEKELSPESFPEIFYPPTDILYVLELPAGSFEKNRVDIGDFVSWK